MGEAVYHLAQVNVGRMRAPLSDSQMAGFVALLEPVNRLADESPGFVWRLQTEAGDATALRPFPDEMVLVNLSVWESPEHLRAYVYRGEHAAALRERRQWFERFEGVSTALWWVPAGERPTPEEARRRLEHLQEHGESEHAFSFRRLFPPPAEG